MRSCVLLWTIAAATAAAQPAFTPAMALSAPNPAVVRIVAPERDGASYGSGTLVAVNESSGLVVTNWHVVRDAAGQISVVFPDGFRSGAYLLRTNQEWDLAALAIRRPRVQPIAISNEVPRPGEPLTIAGYGSGSYRAATGRLTQYFSPGDNRPSEILELSAQARNGDSGGPILNARGQLAGTLFGSSYGCTAGSYCGRVRWFLASVDGDFRRISAQALLAQQSRANASAVATTSSLPLAEGSGAVAANAVGPLAREQPIGSPLPLGEGPVVRASSRALASDLTACSSSSGPSSPWSPVVAPRQPPRVVAASIPAPPASPLPNTDQMKTILAAVGIIAVLYHILRLLGWAVG